MLRALLLLLACHCPTLYSLARGLRCLTPIGSDCEMPFENPNDRIIISWVRLGFCAFFFNSPLSSLHSCHSGFVGTRCEHADLLAVVAANQKKQTITALVVVSVVASVVLIVACVLIHCCQIRKHCEWCRAFICRHEKPSGLLKGGTSCCHSETAGVGSRQSPNDPSSVII
uniref:Transforming growth factor alpha n=1 Tax=Terrapene triunguis TaxID=2587831 RepID=A0A674IH30_9SAUR